MSDQFPDLMTMVGYQRRGAVQDTSVPAKALKDMGWEKWAEDDARGVPLVIAESHDDVVAFEDSDGVQFVVPRAWVKHDVENYKGDELVSHAVIDAPPGELERIWKKAAEDDYIAGRQAMRERGEIPVDAKDADPRDVYSQLDSWNELLQTTSGRKAAGNVPLSTQQAGASGWQPRVRQPAPPTIRRKEDIPPDAGSGLGNWDEEWDDRLQRWVKVR